MSFLLLRCLYSKSIDLIESLSFSLCQAFIRDQSFDPNHFYAVGRPCPVICDKQTEKNIHGQCGSVTDGAKTEVRCSKCHQWLRKKTIADIVEALVGAFIVDSGFKAAIAFLKCIGIYTDFEESQVKSICAASKVFMPLADEIDIPAIENLLGYPFVHKGLLIQAFIHPSYNNHGGGCYQVWNFSFSITYFSETLWLLCRRFLVLCSNFFLRTFDFL